MRLLKYGIILILIVSVLPVSVVLAQDGGDNEETESPLPQEVRLEGLQQAYQLYNRCSAAALDILLSYYDWEGTHTEIVQWLNPNPEDKSVRVEEMKVLVESQRPDLRVLIRTGGDLDLLKALVAGGFPVLIETSYFDANDSYDDWMGHNRVVMGYDIGRFYVFDPLRGSGEDNRGFAMPHYELDERWRPFSRIYVVAYRVEDEEKLQDILGERWDEQSNFEQELEYAVAEREELQDAFSVFNLAAVQTNLGMYEEAAQNFDLARQLGLPKRMMWYRFEPFEAYLQVGRNVDTIDLVYEVLNGTREVEEMYYYVGRAAQAMGDLERAGANYRAALNRNEHFIAAREALSALEAQQ